MTLTGATAAEGSMPGKAVLFFCVRADNDADHLVPVIDAVARRRDYVIRVVVYDPIKTYEDDYRFVYLRRTYGIEPEHIFDLPGIPALRRLRTVAARKAFDLLLLAQRRLVGLLPQAVTARPLQSLRTRLSKSACNAEAAAALIGQVLSYRRGAVIFDHTMNPLAQAVGAAVRPKGFAMAALPHSVPHVASLLRNSATGKTRIPGKGWHDFYDALTVPNEPSISRLAADGTPREIISILGSARFGAEWGETLDRIAPKFDWPTDKPKIVFILSKHGPYVDWPGVNDVVAELSRGGRAAVVVKPHTRTEINGLPDMREGELLRVAGPEVPTCSLIQWADLVIFWGSSVIYDAIRLRKPALHLNYLISLDFDFENYMHRWRVESRDELRHRLDDFLAAPAPTYDEAEARACIAALVGDESDSSIAERYCSFIDRLAGNPAPVIAARSEAGIPAAAAPAART